MGRLVDLNLLPLGVSVETIIHLSVSVCCRGKTMDLQCSEDEEQSHTKTCDK